MHRTLREIHEFVKHNPFSTRKTSPGQVPFFFGNCDFDSLAGKIAGNESEFGHLYDHFVQFDYWAQIVGGHGTGKTTFLAHFIALLNKNGHPVGQIALHDGQRKLPQEFWEQQKSMAADFKRSASKKPSITIIDGYEQLSLLQKSWLQWFAFNNKLGLLVTTHTKKRHFPVLFQTKTNFDILLLIVEHLFREQNDLTPPDRVLCLSLFERHRGNLRDVLFELYDHYEASAK